MNIVEIVSQYGLHGLLLLIMIYLVRRQNLLEKMLMKCIGGDKPTEADLTELGKGI